jgi:hypothetical protein
MVLKGAINKSDPNVFDISLVTPTGEEKETIRLPADTLEEDVMDEIEQLIGRLNVPFKEVRVYRGQDLFYKEDLEMPGLVGQFRIAFPVQRRGAIGGTFVLFQQRFQDLIHSLQLLPSCLNSLAFSLDGSEDFESKREAFLQPFQFVRHTGTVTIRLG